MTPEDVALRAIRATQFDACDSLFWRVDDGTLSMFAVCSDTFAPACADCEPITADNVEAFEQAVADCVAIDPGEQYWGPLLFAARMRKARAIPSLTRDMPAEIRALFDAVTTEGATP